MGGNVEHRPMQGVERHPWSRNGCLSFKVGIPF